MPEQKMISHYRLLGAAGHGGMAAVYVAQDLRIDRRVVIKVLPSHFEHNPQFRQRFLQEAKVMVSLIHPNIVPVYEYGEEEDQPFLVMGYMSGGTLGERISRGPIGLNDSIGILTPIASAIDYAHGKGIIHRDLKPSNILFSEGGAAYLADFGIAKLAEATQSFTGSAIIGTPAYMSPEQVQAGQRLDGRSDIYSLGVILYEMLSGEVPYKADTPTQQLMMHILEPVPAIRQIKPEITPGVEAALQRAMAKEPGQRFQNAGAFISSLMSPQASPLPPTHIEPLAAVAATALDGPPGAETLPAAAPAPAEQYNRYPEPQPAAKASGNRTTMLLAIIAVVLFLIVICGALYIWFDRQNGGQILAGDGTGGNASPTNTVVANGEEASGGIETSPLQPDPAGNGLLDSRDADQGQLAEIEDTPTATKEPSPTATTVPSDTPTATPTATPLPPTDTPTAIPTATMTPTPGLVSYTITIHTGCVFLAGTDANVYATLFGDGGESSETLLDNPGVNDHEACDSHSYQISATDLGEINSVRIRHDNSGFAPGWFLDGVFIRNEATGEERYFSNNQWLATDEGDGRISRDLK